MFSQSPQDAEELTMVSLPERDCYACRTVIHRRVHRVVIKASWRPTPETLCTRCWHTICLWASRFAMEQKLLPLMDDLESDPLPGTAPDGRYRPPRERGWKPKRG